MFRSLCIFFILSLKIERGLLELEELDLGGKLVCFPGNSELAEFARCYFDCWEAFTLKDLKGGWC